MTLLPRWLTRRRTAPVPADLPSRAVEWINLNDWNDRCTEAITPIGRPDSLSPVVHRPIGLDPDQADARLAVTQQIRELAEAGALDEGTGDVLDYHIDAQASIWEARARAHHDRQRDVALQLISVDVQNLTRAAAELAYARERLAQVATLNRWAREALAGSPVTPLPAVSTTADEAGAVPAVRSVDVASRINVLLAATAAAGDTSPETTSSTGNVPSSDRSTSGGERVA